ncbi:MAG: hypothetical protein HYX92_09130 [Chloroflexi bacterium]|nr:hypothetical protein [Chloroflexota bacterium]
MSSHRKFHKLVYLVTALSLLLALLVLTVAPGVQAMQNDRAGGDAPVAPAKGEPGVGKGFIATIDGVTYPQPGQEKAVVILKFDQVMGKAMHLQGDFVAMDVDLDNFTISDLTVEGTILYSMVVPQLGSDLSEDLVLRFEPAQIEVERMGPRGKIVFSADDGNDGDVIRWAPEPRLPALLDIFYTLGPGIRHTGVLTDVVGEPRLVFEGLKQGFETSVATPDKPDLAKLLSWTATTSVWAVSPLSAVDSEIEGPFGTGSFVAYINGVPFLPKRGNKATNIKVKARTVAGQTMQIVGAYNTLSINLDTFAVSNFTSGGVVLYTSVAPQLASTLTGDLLIMFDKERIRLERAAPGGPMKFSAFDANFLRLMEWSPNPLIDIAFTLGAGLTYTAPTTDAAGVARLPFSGLGKAGWETSRVSVNDPGVATLVSWTPTSSVWKITPESAVVSEFPIP